MFSIHIANGDRLSWIELQLEQSFQLRGSIFRRKIRRNNQYSSQRPDLSQVSLPPLKTSPLHEEYTTQVPLSPSECTTLPLAEQTTLSWVSGVIMEQPTPSFYPNINGNHHIVITPLLSAHPGRAATQYLFDRYFEVVHEVFPVLVKDYSQLWLVYCWYTQLSVGRNRIGHLSTQHCKNQELWCLFILSISMAITRPFESKGVAAT